MQESEREDTGIGRIIELERGRAWNRNQVKRGWTDEEGATVEKEHRMRR